MVFVSSKEGTNFGKDTTFCTTMIMMCRKKGGFMGRKSVFLLHLPSRMDENAHRGVQNGAIAVRAALQSKALAHRTGYSRAATDDSERLFTMGHSSLPEETFTMAEPSDAETAAPPKPQGQFGGAKQGGMCEHTVAAIRTRDCRIRDRPYRLSRQRCRSAFLHRSHRKPRQQHVQISALGA